jgi:hypothetical protein
MRAAETLELALLGLMAVVGALRGAMGPRAPDYHPQIDPSNFQATVDNPYYPLVPGTTLTYIETDKGEVSQRVVAGDA